MITYGSKDDLAWMLAIDRVLANEEEGVPEVARFNAGQKFVFWSMAFAGPGVLYRPRNLGSLFRHLHLDRNAAFRTADPFPGGNRGDHHLDHSRLRSNLGQGLDACDDYDRVSDNHHMAQSFG